MTVEYRYSVVFDLLYHILAHMKVENASDLYSEAYIAEMNRIKNEEHSRAAEAVSCFSDYYNENFERLGVINFLPFVCDSVQELVGALEKHEGFTETDRAEFVEPFSRPLMRELEFYEGYWNRVHDANAACRHAFESWFNREMSKFQALFDYFGKSAVAGMSYSLTNNGRGYGNASSFSAVVPFAYDEGDYRDVFYQVLHEYTHQFTDRLLGERIRMDDGTHDLSEKAVILFDYYLIRRLDDENTDSYMKWFASLVNADECDEMLFLSALRINDDINDKLLGLVEDIVGNRKDP